MYYICTFKSPLLQKLDPQMEHNLYAKTFQRTTFDAPAFSLVVTIFSLINYFWSKLAAVKEHQLFV